MQYELTIYGFNSGLNELIAGRTYDFRTKKYRNWVKNKNDDLCSKQIKQSCLAGVFIDKPIKIDYSFYVKNKMHDRMNTASAFIKSFEDSLQKCGVIKNDGYDYVLTPELSFAVDRGNPRVEIVISVIED